MKKDKRVNKLYTLCIQRRKLDELDEISAQELGQFVKLAHRWGLHNEPGRGFRIRDLNYPIAQSFAAKCKTFKNHNKYRFNIFKQ